MEREKKLRARRRILLPFYVLICGLAATALATYLVNENIDFRNRQQVKDARHQLERTIQSRMEAYIGLLRGGAGLFAANESVTLNEFRRFQQRLEVDRRYPGLQGFGYSVSFPRERLEELIDSMRDQGLTNFNVWPAGERQHYHSIVFLEPQSARNQKAIGYDMFTEPMRRRAMEEARDRGEPRLTRKVELVQELADDQEKQPGFLIYLPVYQGGDVPGDLEERRSNLQGFIYSPFRAGDLFGSVVSGVNLPGLAFAVWDGTNKTSDDLLFQSNPRFDVRNVVEFSRVDVTGSQWTMGVAPLEKSRPMEGSEMLLAVPLLGVIGSILLCYFTYTEGKARTRSEATANELFNQREWLQTTLRSIGDGVISTNLNGDVEFMNAAAELLTGWKYDQAYGKKLSDIFPINNEETGKPTENPIERVLATGMMATLPEHTLLIDRRGTLRSIDDSAAPIRDRKGNLVGAILVFREISERRRYERRSTAQHEVTRVLAESPSLSEAATRVLESLCMTLQFEWGVLWLFDEQRGYAEAAYQWHRPETNGAAFEQACREFKPRKGEGLPGMVWAQGQPVWIKNFSSDPRFARAEVARALRFRTAFSFPVQSDSRQFGAIEFFRWEINEPDGELLNVMRGIGAQLGQFMQRKRAEEALAESEALYRSISDTAADGIVVLDEQSRIVMANSAMERIFGSRVNDLIGSPIHNVLPKRVRGERDQDIERLIAAARTGSWAGVEFVGLHRDGTEIPVEISFGVARHGDSHLFTGFIRDIRQRKEAERKLRETEERFALLVRLAEEYAIIIMGPDGRITTWNSGAQRIFGYVDHEVVGQDGSIFFTAEDQAAGTPEQQLRTAESEGQLLDERWQVRKDGSTFWASGSTVCLRAEDGTVRGFAKILRDITERKRMEMSIKEMNQELEIRVQRRTAALQESKEQMEAFSYTVAHDLRAPLRAMQGFAYTLMDEYQNMLDLAGSDYLRRIMSSAERMDALIQDLLQYSRLSGSELSFSPVAVHEAVQTALQQCEQEIERAGAEVQVFVKPVFVMAHAATLENALANLIANALKFRRPGVAPKITIRAINRDEFVQVSVQDNGIGIAREHHGRIFRVFERLHGVNKFPGTGIGLAMVKKGVERMGGRVGLSSDPGEGSLFWIELPRATEELAVEENDDTMASENGRR